MKCPLPRADCETVILYERGEPAIAVAFITGSYTAAVLRHLRSHGVAIRPPGCWPKPTALVRRSEAVRLYQNDNWSAAQIAVHLGVSRERVRQFLVEATGGYSRPHRCGGACRAVLGAPTPVRLTVLAQSSGVSEPGLRRAAWTHGVLIAAGHRGHVCGDHCARLRLALDGAPSVHAAAVAAEIPPQNVYQRLRAYHRDWPWPPPARPGRRRMAVVGIR